jgi:hypothetical protein
LPPPSSLLAIAVPVLTAEHVQTCRLARSNDQGNPFLYGRPVARTKELIESGDQAKLLDSVQ